MEQLIKYIANPESGRANFEMAKFYLEQKHYAGAISHFLRTAEWGDLEQDKDIIYESLIQLAVCLGALGNRQYSEEGWLLQAIAFQPQRPEAYWLHSLYHERKNLWIETYTDAVIGLRYLNNAETMEVSIGYEDCVLDFQKCVAAWWIGRTKESRELLFSMSDKYNLSPKYAGHVQNNMIRIGMLDQKDSFFTYTKNDLHRFRFPFPGIENIERNYSQVYQDMFVLAMLNGKRNGYYLEIGSGDPFFGNNTAILEKDFGWKGVSIDLKEDEVKKFREQRKNPVYCKNALYTDFHNLLQANDAPRVIDYLQVDCEPAKTTYDALLSVPFSYYKFAVVTFEHDYYADITKAVKEKSRKYMEKMGYVLAVDEVGFNNLYSFEDWWVHPDLVDADTLARMKSITGKPRKIHDYILKYTNIDWGLFKGSNGFEVTLYDEVFVKDMYQKFFEVEEGDVVVDIGASIGVFPMKIEEKNPDIVYCFEPHRGCYETLIKNTRNTNINHIEYRNEAIADTDGQIELEWMNLDALKTEPNIVQGVKFSTFINENSITKIDFLKMDCEGGEYAVFTDENLPWIKANVRKMAIEFHSWGDFKEKFRKFRDTYLPQFNNYYVTSFDGVDIKAGLWEENFLNYWNYFYIYIDNRL